MPNKDGTGPGGKGPKTGRQMGKCEGNQPINGQGRVPCSRRLRKKRCWGEE